MKSEVKFLFNGIQQDGDGHLVHPPLGNDDIGIPFGGLNKLKVHGFDRFLIPFQHLFHIPSPFHHVSFDHPSKPVIMHMDFQRVDENKSIRVHVPLHFTGEDVAPGVKAGGLVSHELIEVELEVLPKHLPEFIEVDISALNIGDSLHLTDLSLPETGSLVELSRGEGHDLPLVSIHARRGGGEEEAGGAAAAEGGEEAAEGEG